MYRLKSVLEIKIDKNCTFNPTVGSVRNSVKPSSIGDYQGALMI